MLLIGAKKKRVVFLSSLVLGVVAALIIISVGKGISSLNAMCRNQIVSKADSPDGKWQAIIFHRGCGATTRETTNVSVIKQGRQLPNQRGNVFVLDGAVEAGDPPIVEVRWDELNRLIIAYDKEYVVEYAQGRIFRGVILSKQHLRRAAVLHGSGWTEELDSVFRKEIKT